MKNIIDKIQQRWRYRKYPQSKNVDEILYQLAAEQSGQYVIEHMKTTPNYDYDLNLHRALIKKLNPVLLSQGYVLEFGVATGRTIKHIARLLPDQQIWGFDSFQGLPENWSWLFPRGSFRNRRPRVPDNVHLVEGLFSETLPGWCSNLKGPVALLHIDCDLYSSTSFVLEQLQDRLVPGSIIIFDEYLNFPGWQQDEFRAWQEFVLEYQIAYEYIGRVGSHQQVAVRVISKVGKYIV